MNTRVHRSFVFLMAVLIFLIAPEDAYAYGGPGSVVSAIGTFLAVVAAIFAAVFGFLWFPLKRLYKKMTAKRAEIDDE